MERAVISGAEDVGGWSEAIEALGTTSLGAVRAETPRTTSVEAVGPKTPRTTSVEVSGTTSFEALETESAIARGGEPTKVEPLKLPADKSTEKSGSLLETLIGGSTGRTPSAQIEGA